MSKNKFQIGDKAVYNRPTDLDYDYYPFAGDNSMDGVEVVIVSEHLEGTHEGFGAYEVRADGVKYTQFINPIALTKVGE